MIFNIIIRPSDLCLVEKIECTSEGVIYFACASVDTPKKPKVNGRNRTTVKVIHFVFMFAVFAVFESVKILQWNRC
jgi:hypothetical protein